MQPLYELAAHDALMRWALVAAAVLALLSLVLMAQVLVLSELAIRGQRRRAAFEAAWRPRLAAASLGELPPAGTQPVRPRERVWLLQAWCHMQYRLRGTAHASLNTLLRNYRLDAFALELLASRNISSQLLALATLRHLADPAHWHRVEPLAAAPGPIRALSAAEVLVAIDPARAMRRLVPLAIGRRDWVAQRFALLGQQAGPAAMTPPLLLALGDEHSPHARSRLLELLPLGDPGELAGWARRTLSSDVQAAGDEARGAALRILEALGDPRDRDRIVQSLGDPADDVRLAALGALAAQSVPEDLTRLRILLGDRTWAVRQAAAEAIAALPGMDQVALLALLPSVTDRYGRDALLRVVTERGR